MSSSRAEAAAQEEEAATSRNDLIRTESFPLELAMGGPNPLIHERRISEDLQGESLALDDGGRERAASSASLPNGSMSSINAVAK